MTFLLAEFLMSLMQTIFRGSNMYLSWAHCRPTAFTSSGVWSFWLATVQTFSLRTAAVRLPVTWLLHAVIIRCWRKHLSKWNQLPKFHSETIFSLLWSVSFRSLPLFFSRHEISQTWPGCLAPWDAHGVFKWRRGSGQRRGSSQPRGESMDIPLLLLKPAPGSRTWGGGGALLWPEDPRLARGKRSASGDQPYPIISPTSSSSWSKGHLVVKDPTHSYTHHQRHQSHPHHIVIVLFSLLLINQAGGDGRHAAYPSLHSGGLAQGQRVVARGQNT